MEDIIEKYEKERDELIKNINTDYDAKIAKIKADKETVSDAEVEKVKVELGEDEAPKKSTKKSDKK